MPQAWTPPWSAGAGSDLRDRRRGHPAEHTRRRPLANAGPSGLADCSHDAAWLTRIHQKRLRSSQCSGEQDRRRATRFGISSTVTTSLSNGSRFVREDQARAIGLESAADDRLPVCVFPDGTRLERPTIRSIAEKLGWFRDPSRSEYDLAIYGAGPAGLSAAVYGASEGLKTVVVERWAVGGQAGSSPKIENYLGFPQGISGAELAERAREQACRFGAEILIAREGVRGEFSAGKRVGYLSDGSRVVARAAICATGVDYHRLPVPDEQRLRGAGVYYGAGASEAALCAGHPVVVVGGGNSAAQATLHFSRYVPHVMLVVRGDSLKSTVSAYLIDRIYAANNVEVLTHTEVTGPRGRPAARRGRGEEQPDR